MRNIARLAFSVGAAALAAGCAGSQPPMSPGAIPQDPTLAARADGAKYKILHSFTGIPDGAFPVASLIAVDGTLYGTTSYGGSYASYCYGDPDDSCGTVFAISPGGTESVLHSFGEGSDGVAPAAPLIEVKGKLYGTTQTGPGAYGHGTVFRITVTGVEKVLYDFPGKPDGSNPKAGLVNVGGVLYGTTYGGGAYTSSGFTDGTVFSITPDGSEKVLHSFGSGTDGANPEASLIAVHGTLYGTTYAGGTYGRGTVFSITPSGSEKVLHSFCKGTDGFYPSASLVAVNGTLYGTTQHGGTYNNRGTVFSISLSGSEKVLHDFGNETDGAIPSAPLLDVNGTLYGTTQEGGSSSTCGPGCGTVFSITTGGTEKVLHSLGNGGYANNPVAGLGALNGMLYGTTMYGGSAQWGTVFALAL
jgi:uncharacterized repeat protein (TIGR03803 family)